MSRRFHSGTVQDTLDAEWERWPANERPPFPPSSLPTFPDATGSPTPRLSGETTETPAVPPLLSRAAAVSVTPSIGQE